MSRYRGDVFLRGRHIIGVHYPLSVVHVKNKFSYANSVYSYQVLYLKIRGWVMGRDESGPGVASCCTHALIEDRIRTIEHQRILRSALRHEEFATDRVPVR